MRISNKKPKESKVEFVLIGKNWNSQRRAEKKIEYLEGIGYKKIKENDLKKTYKKVS